MTKFVPNPNHWYRFYGCDNNYIRLDSDVVEIREDEDDGYRSAMDDMYLVDTKELNPKPIFFRRALAEVQVLDLDERDESGWRLVDRDGHVWLEAGTDYCDSYYPCFFIRYTPKDKRRDELEERLEVARQKVRDAEDALKRHLRS